MSHLLALDQSSRITGWSVFIDGELKEYGKFTLSQSDVGERLFSLREKVKELIDKYEIDELIFEDIQLQGNVSNNVKTFKVLAEVYGTIEELATELAIPHFSVLAVTWKAGLGIKGSSRAIQKAKAQEYVLNTYNAKVTSDEADAISIGAYWVGQDKGFNWS